MSISTDGHSGERVAPEHESRVWPVMLVRLTRWLEAGLPVELPLVTLLKARQRHQRVGVIGVPAHSGAFQTRRGGLAHRFGRAAADLPALLKELWIVRLIHLGVEWDEHAENLVGLRSLVSLQNRGRVSIHALPACDGPPMGSASLSHPIHERKRRRESFLDRSRFFLGAYPFRRATQQRIRVSVVLDELARVQCSSLAN